MKTVIIQNVKGLLYGERTRTGFNVAAKVNAYGFVTLYQAGTGIRLEPHLKDSLITKLERLARKACKHGQEIVDWTAR
jgi:hypothetical protein